MSSIPPHPEENFSLALEPGYPWAARCELVADVVRWFMMEHSGGHTYRNGDLTAAILKAYDRPNHKGAAQYRPLSQVITELGKWTDFERWIVPGRQIAWGRHPNGERKYSTERLWRYPDWKDDNPQVDKEEPTVKPEVDNVSISRHPKPGYEQVTCGQCGGCGKVYINRS